MFLYGIPLDFVLNAVGGLSWDKSSDVILYYVPGGEVWVWGLNVKVQDGWNIFRTIMSKISFSNKSIDPVFKFILA